MDIKDIKLYAINKSGKKFDKSAKNDCKKADLTQKNPQNIANTLDCLANYNIVNVSNNFTTHQNSFSDVKNQLAQIFLKEISLTSPEKCEILLDNENIKNCLNSNCGIFSDEFEFIHTEDLKTIKKAITKLSEDDINYVLTSLSDKYQEEIDGDDLMTALVIYSKDKECYEYMLNSPVQSENIVHSSGYTKDLCKYICQLPPSIAQNISYNTAIEIDKELQKGDKYYDYTSNSDSYKSGSQKAKELNELLSQNLCQGDFSVYRGEKSSWMFDNIPIDAKMAKKVRTLAFISPKSRKDLVYQNNNCYSNTPDENIYDYIKNKKDLTLADAMLVCKYANSGFIEKVLDKINSAEIIDNNFKSFTLSENFAKDWARKKNFCDDKNMLSMVSKTTIKKGNQIGYSSKSGQFEFILNNNDKKMTFSNAKYDKETNTFTFDSDIEAVEN
ncbi:MAG: hypothetical protein E7Z91_04110 [Cyanobacteria bacterium SIG30]|nr:hypothetical protein [Cyanobacteria bacterium SIG30]